MKMIRKSALALILACAPTALMIHACPTCVARIEKNAPPFFEDDDIQHLTTQPEHAAVHAATPNNASAHTHTNAPKPAPAAPRANTHAPRSSTHHEK